MLNHGSRKACSYFLIFAVMAQIRLDVEEKREKRESHMHLINDRGETTRIM